MNRERTAYTGWMTGRDQQLFHVLLDSRYPLEGEPGATATDEPDSHAA
jgi:hypothetical protein